MSDSTLPAPNELPTVSRKRSAALSTALVVIWSVDEPERLGELVLFPSDGRTGILGRGTQPDGNSQTAELTLARQRPGTNTKTGPLTSQHISRKQLQIAAGPRNSLSITNIGRCPMLVNGLTCETAELTTGDVLELKNQVAFVCVRRIRTLPVIPNYTVGTFGESDEHGIVGESAEAWQLREAIARLSGRSAHVLIHGPSGTGKELIAQALHQVRTQNGPIVSRNAATLPESLVDAELFGNLKNYPNPGMAQREGLVGDANGGTLFLDEIGELPTTAQAHLLRVLDSGEYQRLGESRMRRSRFRLIAATNRDPAQLKTDLAARMKLRISVPGLNGRPEDVPLIARHLLREMAQEDPSIADRFFDEADLQNHPRMTPQMVRSLVQQAWTTNVRELERLLWVAVDNSHGAYIDTSPHAETSPIQSADAEELSPERIRVALERHNGVREKVWRELGLKNRHVLTRLMRKHGLN